MNRQEERRKAERDAWYQQKKMHMAMQKENCQDDLHVNEDNDEDKDQVETNCYTNTALYYKPNAKPDESGFALGAKQTRRTDFRNPQTQNGDNDRRQHCLTSSWSSDKVLRSVVVRDSHNAGSAVFISENSRETYKEDLSSNVQTSSDCNERTPLAVPNQEQLERQKE